MSLCVVKELRNRFRPKGGRRLSLEDVPRLLTELAEILSDLTADDDRTRYSASEIVSVVEELNSAGDDIAEAVNVLSEWTDEIEQIRRANSLETAIDRADREYAETFPWRLQASA